MTQRSPEAADSDNSNKSLVEAWRDRLRPEFAGYARVALDNIGKEFPSHVSNVMQEPGDFPHRPKDRNPVFFGSFDWHSCVEMHWVLVRLLKTDPESVPEREIRDVLNAQFTAEGLEAEARFIATSGRLMERPYGWGWGLALVDEVETWDDPDARRWAAALEPLAQAIEGNFLGWLPKATYPHRTGVHNNSSFGLSKSLPYAARRPDGELDQALRATAARWYLGDENYPGAWEPSGSDFLSAALCEAELMTSILPAGEFPSLDRVAGDDYMVEHWLAAYAVLLFS